jgi:CelD/BcsL family acetyltransferase involved in cellulose biosynthesis
MKKKKRRKKMRMERRVMEKLGGLRFFGVGIKASQIGMLEENFDRKKKKEEEEEEEEKKGGKKKKE